MVDAFAKLAIPVNVGEPENTSCPVPVSSDTIPATFAEVSSEEDASPSACSVVPTNARFAPAVIVDCLLLNVFQSVAVRRPRFEADAEGRLKVKTFDEVEIVKSVPFVVVANCWIMLPA